PSPSPRYNCVISAWHSLSTFLMDMGVGHEIFAQPGFVYAPDSLKRAGSSSCGPLLHLVRSQRFHSADLFEHTRSKVLSSSRSTTSIRGMRIFRSDSIRLSGYGCGLLATSAVPDCRA